MMHCKTLRYLFAAAALFAGLGLGLLGAPRPALALTDLPPSHWAASTINAYVSRGIMNGYPDGTFQPEAPVTRAEFVKMVNSVFGYTTPTTISFPDVSYSYWGYDEIAKGVFAGYINGDENGYFNPESPLTREEAASIVSRIKGLAPNQSPCANYTDSARISAWAKPSVGSVTQFGYMQGNGDGAFEPLRALSRAEAASVLSKAEAKTYSSSNSSSGSGSTSSNTSTNSNTLHRDNYTTSSSDRVSDYTLGSSQTTLSDKTVTGNLYIPSGLGSKTVHLDNLTVEGTVFVRGGGTIDVDDCDFNRVVLDKSGVLFTTDSKSVIDQLDFWRNGRIEGKGYGDVNIADDDVSTATIDAEVDSVLLDTDANVRLLRNASVDDFEATSNANSATINLASDAYVGDMSLYDHVEITGSGEIDRMYTYVSGIYSSIKPNKLVTSGNGAKPHYTDRDDDDDDDDNSGSSNNNNSGSSSSNRPGSNSNTTPKDLIVTSNLNGSDAKKGDTAYDTVTVTRAGVTISNVIIDKNLVIDAAVADGTVTFDHVTVKGQTYIHGGGQNSIIFSDCTFEGDIFIDKKPTETIKQPVGLKLNNGTNIKGAIYLTNNAHIATSPKEHKIGRVVINGTLTEPLQISANIEKLHVESASPVTLVLDNCEIETLTTESAKAKVTAKGKGNINDVSSVPSLEILEEVNLPNLKTIVDISGIPDKIEMGAAIKLDSCQAKYSDNTTATLNNAIWTVKDGQKADVTITDNVLTAGKTEKEFEFTLTATVQNGKGIGNDYTQDFTVEVTEIFVPAEEVNLNVEKSYTLEEGKPTEIDLTKATVAPSNASNKAITWSVKSEPSDAAEIIKDNDKKLLILKQKSKVTLTATVPNGKADGNLTKTFNINVDAPYCPVGNIKLKDLSYDDKTEAYQAYVGSDFTLKATVEPPTEKANATPTYTSIRWELLEADNTGVTKDQVTGAAPTIRTINTGEILLKAIVAGGKTNGTEDYEQEIRIKVNPSLIGDIHLKPTALETAGQNTYYRGQTVELSLDNSIMAANKLIWSIDNKDELLLYMKETETTKMPTLSGTKFATLTIPEDFPSDKIDTIKIKVQNEANRGAYKSVLIKVAQDDFKPVTNIIPGFKKPGEENIIYNMTGGESQLTIDLAKDTAVQPAEATCKDITWSVTYEKGDAKVQDNKNLIVTEPGTYKVTATIKNGIFPGQDKTESFDIEVLVPVIGPIEPETQPLDGNNYYSGQKVSFTMDKSIMNEHSSEIKWNVEPVNSMIYTASADTKHYVFTINPTFAGELTVIAKNGELEEKYPINVTKFNTIEPGDITITVPKSFDPPLLINKTLQLSYDTDKELDPNQSIVWSISKDSKAKDSSISSDGLLKIGSNEEVNEITIVAAVTNGKLNSDNNTMETVENVASITIEIDLGEIKKVEPVHASPSNDNTYYSGQTIQFKVDDWANQANGKNITWEISNLKDILQDNTTGNAPSINKTTGLLTIPEAFKPENPIELKIKASIPSGGSKEIPITVKAFTPVKSFSISSKNNIKQAEQGATVDFTSNIKPTDATNQTITWTVTNNIETGTTITPSGNGNTATLTIDPNEPVNTKLTITATINKATIPASGNNANTFQPINQTITITVTKPADNTTSTTSLSLRDDETSTIKNDRNEISKNETNAAEEFMENLEAQRKRIERKNQAARPSIGSVKKTVVSAD